MPTPYLSPALIQMAKTVLATPAGRGPGELEFARAVLEEAKRLQDLGPTNGETGSRAPKPETRFTDGNNFLDPANTAKRVPVGSGEVPEFLRSPEKAKQPTPVRAPTYDFRPVTGGLQGAELEQLNRAMGVRPVVAKEVERLATGELVLHHIGPTRARELERQAAGRKGGAR